MNGAASFATSRVAWLGATKTTIVAPSSDVFQVDAGPQ